MSNLYKEYVENTNTNSYALVISFPFHLHLLSISKNKFNYKTSNPTKKTEQPECPSTRELVAISFFLSVRLLGKADDIFVYISFLHWQLLSSC